MKGRFQGKALDSWCLRQAGDFRVRLIGPFAELFQNIDSFKAF
ncbi:MAG: hypothetical protein K0S07_648 [Chlamydiales bacterium]|nr:hypothetical protein [Chlamydiales bacterium]